VRARRQLSSSVHGRRRGLGLCIGIIRRMRDPYAILGVPRDATPLQVARAHRRLAKRFHPDLHPDAATLREMQRINEAWQILSVPGRRAEWDRLHPAPTPRAPADAGAHWVASTRRPVNVSAPSTTATWATWRASAAETRAAQPTPPRYGAPYVRPRVARAAAAPVAEAPSVRDSGWAAIAIAVLLVMFVIAVAFIGNAVKADQWRALKMRSEAPIVVFL
jgi:hypothetical protein